MMMQFSKSEGKIKTEFGTINATCKVRNELTKSRGKTELVYPIVDGVQYDSSPYMPRTFPTGVFNVTAVEETDNPVYAPFKIRTDATQKVRLWNVNEKGEYTKPSDVVVEDTGYLLHHSNSNTTLGCIRIATAREAGILAGLVKNALDANEKVTIEVVD